MPLIMYLFPLPLFATVTTKYSSTLTISSNDATETSNVSILPSISIIEPRFSDPFTTTSLCTVKELLTFTDPETSNL